MEITDILNTLGTHTGSFPRKAIKAAIEKREEITPELLCILEEAYDWELDYDENRQDAESKSFLCLYALFLLAQFREVRAYPLVINLMNLPEEKLDDLIGDSITENLDRILASVCDGDTSLIEDLIESPEPYEYARGAGVSALKILAATNDKSRDEIMAYYKTLFNERLERSGSHVWNELISCATRLHPEDVYDEIVAAYKEGLADDCYMTLDDVERVHDMSREKVLGRLATATMGYIEDTIREMHWWPCFNENNREQPRTVFEEISPPPPTSPMPIQKIGLNDPCYCGSGRKYKKCCGRIS